MNEAQRLNQSIAAGKKTQEPSGTRSIGYAMNWAWRIRFIPMNLKLPLLAMAGQANATGVCEVPVRWLADHCNVNVRHMQKLILVLRDLELITVIDLNPGTVDRTRLFALRIATDPDLWEPPPSKLPLMRHRGTVVLKTQAFHDRLSQMLQENPKLFGLYRAFLINVEVMEIAAAGGPNARLKLRVPHKEAAREIHGDCRSSILAAASEVSGVAIKKTSIIHERRRNLRK